MNNSFSLVFTENERIAKSYSEQNWKHHASDKAVASSITHDVPSLHLTFFYSVKKSNVLFVSTSKHQEDNLRIEKNPGMLELEES